MAVWRITCGVITSTLLTRFILSEQTNQHVADMIWATEEDREDADLLRSLIDVEPVDGAINGEISDAGQSIVAGGATDRIRRQSVGGVSDTNDPLRGALQRFFGAFAEADIAFEQVVEDQLEIALALGRKLNRERHAPGASELEAG